MDKLVFLIFYGLAGVAAIAFTEYTLHSALATGAVTIFLGAVGAYVIVWRL